MGTFHASLYEHYPYINEAAPAKNVPTTSTKIIV